MTGKASPQYFLGIDGQLKRSFSIDDAPRQVTAMAASLSASGRQPPREPQGGVALPPSAGTSALCAHGFRHAET